MGKKLWGAVLSFALLFSVLTMGVYAYNGGGREWQGGLKEKIFAKAHFILGCQDELGFSDDQVKRIKDLVIKTERNQIEKRAEIELVDVDIKAEIWRDTLDANTITGLIDRKYELEKIKAKSLINAYVALMSTLTAEQKEKMRDCRKKGCGKERKPGPGPMMQKPK